MQFIAESIDSCCNKLKSLKFRNLDWFGSVPGFQIRGSDRFQTNAGAILTFIFIIQTIACLSFYTSLLFDKSKPDIQTNVYESENQASIHFDNDNIALAFQAYRTDTQSLLTIQEMEENLTLYGAKVGLNVDQGAALLHWTHVPYIKCKDVKQDYVFGTDKWSETLNAICLDLSQISLNPSSQQSKNRIDIKLFRCQETSENISAGISKCKNDIMTEHIFWSVARTRNSLNLDKYLNPASVTYSDTHAFTLEEGLKATMIIGYHKTIIETSKGILGRDQDVISQIEEDSIFYKYTTRSPKQILNNYSVLGKLFMEDALWEMVLVPKKKVKVVKRSYFHLMDMLSDVGGIFEFMSITTFLQYSFYNAYMINKHIIQRVILGKTNMFPEKYNIKKEFNYIACSKVCFCCFKKRLRDKVFKNKVKIYEQCYQAANQKMDLTNYLNDSMNIQATSHLLLKSRHRLLVPLLSLQMTGQKKQSVGDYKNTFLINMYETMDFPVFSVEDAITQIKRNAFNGTTTDLGSIEKAMDVFFLTNFSRDIIDQKDCNLEKINKQSPVLQNNKVKVLSQQNIANVIKKRKKMTNINSKLNTANKIMPIVNTIHKQNDNSSIEKCSSAINLGSTYKNQGSEKKRKQQLEEKGINTFKRKRRSFTDQLIETKQDILDSNCKKLIRTPAPDKDIFQLSVGLAKQAKLRKTSTIKKKLNKEKDYSGFGYQNKATLIAVNKGNMNEDSPEQVNKFHNIVNDFIYKTPTKKKYNSDFQKDDDYINLKRDLVNKESPQKMTGEQIFKIIDTPDKNYDEGVANAKDNVSRILKFINDDNCKKSITSNLKNINEESSYYGGSIDQSRTDQEKKSIYNSNESNDNFEEIRSKE